MANTSAEMITYTGEQSPIQAYLVKPAANEPRPAVIVIHEIYGLSDFVKQTAVRFADLGYVALAPDLFSRSDLAGVLTPQNIESVMQFNASLPREKMGDRSYAQQEIAKLPPDKRDVIQRVFPLLMGGLLKDKLTQDLVKAVEFMKSQSYVRPDKIGSVGFCFGGGLSINLACHTSLAASVVFYGENPAPIELVEKIQGPVLGIYGADDVRINSQLDTLVKSMVQYKRDFEMKIYPGAAHAFMNFTRPQVYREAASKEAWDRLVRFYERTLS
ncbi:MAG: dienelactone hydrolase family protein [Anaerolineaceae bacterium]|nr:dienelactone hydrolase family protein [Anaerolineaceae bacterium]